MRTTSLFAAGAVALAGLAGPAAALTLEGAFAGSYTATSLGSVPGLPTNYGGLTFLPGDPNTLLIGGAANTAGGRLHTVAVTRDGSGRVTGFAGAATPFGDVGEFNDGGVAFGPGGVLFTARWNVNELGQTLPGGTDEARIDDLGPFGVGNSSISAINFVPAGFAGAGKAKIVTYSAGNWHDLFIVPDGAGTFDITSAPQIDLDPGTAGVQSLPGGPEGFVYIDGANAGFGGVDSLLVSEYSAGNVAAYELDGDGNPIVTTRRVFLSGLTGAEGAVIDPVTGDFLFSTFGGGNQVVRVSGFIAPPPPPPPPGGVVPLPAAAWMLLAGIGALGAARRRGRR